METRNGNFTVSMRIVNQVLRVVVTEAKAQEIRDVLARTGRDSTRSGRHTEEVSTLANGIEAGV